MPQVIETKEDGVWLPMHSYIFRTFANADKVCKELKEKNDEQLYRVVYYTVSTVCRYFEHWWYVD